MAGEMDRPARVRARNPPDSFPAVGYRGAPRDPGSHHGPIRHGGFEPDRLRQRSDFWTATLITACWNGFGTHAISNRWRTRPI